MVLFSALDLLHRVHIIDVDVLKCISHVLTQLHSTSKHRARNLRKNKQNFRPFVNDFKQVLAFIL